VNHSPILLVSFIVLGLILMSSATAVLLRVQARHDQWRLRVQSAVGPYRRGSVGIALQVNSGVELAAAAKGLGPALAKLLGFDPALADHYKPRWPTALIATAIVAIVSVKVASGLAGNLVWLLLPVAWILLSRIIFGWSERRRRDKLFEQFPDALAMVVRAVRVGIPVTDSIRAVGRDLEAPTGPEFAQLSHELAIGVVLQDALRAMAERNGLQEYRFFATALSLQTQTGGGLSETLENLADVIRKRVAVRQKGHALAAEAKMSSMVLAALPPLAAVGLFIMNSSYISMLFFDPTGQKILAIAIVTLTCGIVSMNVMIRKSLS
jgi:tight adherence protein B